MLASSVRVPLAELAISNGLFPGLAGVVKTLAGELGRPGSGSTGCCPLRRYGEPEEFGRAAAFVLSWACSATCRW